MDLFGMAREQCGSSADIRRLSTRELPVADRLPRWRDELGRTLTGCESQPIDCGDFAVDWSSVGGARMRIGYCEMVNIRNDRGPALLGDGDDDFTLFVGRRGEGRINHNGRQMTLRSGNAVLTMHGRPILTEWPDAALMVVRIDRRALRTDVADAVLGTVLGASTPLAPLLAAYLRAAHHHGMASGDFAPLVERQLLEIIGAMIANPGDAASASLAVSAARVAAMREAMARRCHEPGLRMRDIAAGAGISARTAYLAFAAEQRVFSDDLDAFRLERAHAMLRSGSAAPIIDIALACGFSDLSHFNRRFRRRFDATPGEVRRHLRSELHT
jgi:AraC-like DNA-binding protein